MLDNQFDPKQSPGPRVASEPVRGPNRRTVLLAFGAIALNGPALHPALAKSTPESSYDGRQELVAAVRAGLKPSSGEIHVAGGYPYVGSPGATVLPDLPGLLPHGDVHVEHFGALGDLRFKLEDVKTKGGGVGQGFVRTAGTNDLPAFQLADEYAAASGAGVIFVDGQYFIDGEFRATARIIGREKFSSCIWLRYGLLESGIRFNSSASGLIGVKVIAQYDAVGLKPSGNGQLGNAITVGDYYTKERQPLISGVDTEVLICRAANIARKQRSHPSIMMSYVGHVEDCRIAVGVHGKTNVSSLMAVLVHWGARYDPASIDRGQLDRTSATILETYHGLDLDISFLTEFDNADGWNFQRPYEIASTGRTTVGPVKTKGLPSVGWVTCGDVCDAYTIKWQKGAVGQGIRIGFATGTDCNPTKAASFCGFFVKGRGESKSSIDQYDGTDIQVSRQLIWDVQCEGFRLEFSGRTAPPAQRGIWVQSCLGRVDLGKVSTFGAPRAVENEYSNCDLLYSYVDGDGALLHEFSQGGRILESSTRVSGEARAVSVVGRMLETTTSADAKAGDTIIPIMPFDATNKGAATDVFVGNTIRVGSRLTVQSRALIQNGAAYLVTTPLPSSVPAGTKVAIDQRARLDSFVGSYESSGDGLVAISADIYQADLSKVRWSGPYAASLRKGSMLQLLHGPEARIGASGLASDAEDGISVDRGSKLVQ
ncbi:hypothetical protein RB623_00140 [Mesorhizobium sp. LHD-90]|uniref:hypothetical protein n=1 Tax=Mesorhizobium sp. LHD-90 TaxID=3071414 RepID=UPI0027E1881F|nr:hypothetical protein [Mesorhizobium sp. LHD-90]MDQ6432458.1 hypothetical protein [Mesorhizobium sp. LHD-90]